MTRLIPLSFALLLLIPATARAQMPVNGFASEARLAVGSAGLEPSLVLGARAADRVQIGLGFQLVRTSGSSQAIPGLPATVATVTTFSFVPQVAVDLLKSKDNHVAWYVRAALPLGAQVNPDPAPNLFALGYEVGLGGRYCPHPNFAVGLEGGISGSFLDPGGNHPGNSGFTSFYGALVGTFYWPTQH